MKVLQCVVVIIYVACVMADQLYTDDDEFSDEVKKELGVSLDEIGRRKTEILEDHLSGYSNASHLVRYAVDGPATYWVSSLQSVFEISVFKSSGWKLVAHPLQATVCYLTRKSHKHHLSAVMNGHAAIPTDSLPLLLNRVEGLISLTDKCNLQESLGAYGGTKAQLLQKRSYIIGSQADCEAFLAEPDLNKKTWVHKLARQSQGVGISFHPPGFTEKNGPCDPQKKGTYSERSLVQEHIDFPMLLSSRKCEFRAYWLIASVDPFIVLLYNNGTTRLATSEYSTENWNNPLKHILNTKQQKRGLNEGHLETTEDVSYESVADDLKWTWARAAREMEKQGRVDTAEQWLSSLREGFQDRVRIVARALEPEMRKLNPFRAGRNRRWELVGLDAILEDTLQRKQTMCPGEAEDCALPVEGRDVAGGLRMFVTEVQIGPGLSTDSALKKVLIPPMLREAMNLILEIDARRAQNKSLDNLPLENWMYVINDAANHPAELVSDDTAFLL
jgi:hypothetical protein